MDATTVINGAGAVAMFFCALWIKGVRDEIRLIRDKVTNHGERLAVVESQVSDLKGKVG